MGSGSGRTGVGDLTSTGLWTAPTDGSAPVLTVQALAAGGEDLQPLSPSAQRLTALLCAGAWHASEVMQIIAYDEELSARLMMVANARLEDSIGTVGNAHTAAMRLGPSRVVELAVGTCVRGPMQRAGTSHGLVEGELWRHSAAASLAVEKLGDYVDGIPPEARTAALLHDVGHLVLGPSLPPDRLALIASDVRDGWVGSRAAELEHLGTDHARIGGSLAGHWSLPPILVDAIAGHHRPHELATPHHARVAAIVAVADMIAATVGAGLGPREHNPVDEGSSLASLGLSGDDFSRACADVFDDLEIVLTWYE